MALTPEVINSVRRYDALIREPQDYGLPPFDSKGWLTAFMAKKQQRADQYAEELRVWAEIEASVTPALVAAYRIADADGRKEIRELLKQNRIFAWGLGWRHRRAPPTNDKPREASELRYSLLLYVMKDGLRDYRDEVVSLDEFCKSAQRSGLDAEQLLREAADLASDAPRGDRPSYREALISRADRLATTRQSARSVQPMRPC